MFDECRADAAGDPDPGGKVIARRTYRELARETCP